MDTEQWDDDGDWAARYEPTTLSPSLANSSIDAQDPKLEVDEENAPERAVLGDQCPICLHALVAPVMLHGCHHVYCFACLSSWVRNLALHGLSQPTCPLCKRVFTSAYANIVSETQYETVYFDGRSSQRHNTPDGAERRAMVYANRMRLASVNSQNVRDVTTLPAPVKNTKREYQAWLERELRACIGPDVDFTVLVTLIHDTLSRRPVDWSSLEAMLESFLLDDTAVFVRELAFFLATRLNMDAYDRVVTYDCGASTPCSIPSCRANHSI